MGLMWRTWPANLLTFGNLGAGALVAWWAASDFDLGMSAFEWAVSLGIDEFVRGIFGISSDRVLGIYLMLLVWAFGLFCDVLDGAVARWMKAEGNQGAMLDSMADFISGGLAPAFVGLHLLREMSGYCPVSWSHDVLLGLPLLVLPAAAWRLARYSRLAIERNEEPAITPSAADFEGIPAPFAAVWWGALLLHWAGVDNGMDATWLWWSCMLGGTALPMLMVSRLPQSGLKKWGHNRMVDVARIAWVAAVPCLWIFGGGLGLFLVLISYPLMGAVLSRIDS